MRIQLNDPFAIDPDLAESQDGIDPGADSSVAVAPRLPRKRPTTEEPAARSSKED